MYVCWAKSWRGAPGAIRRAIVRHRGNHPQAAVESRSEGEMELTRLRGLLDPLDDDTLLEVARAFSQFL